ncbi:hypothetical protein M0R72_08845 [Candidatus Pacearchaeota archaeon]|jgi:hypothetical protein|nr:hypothetical protein [Candidatus Pacearchaeota archaeon]
MTIKIDHIVIHHETDCCPDLSELGKYTSHVTDDERESGRVIDRAEEGPVGSHEHRYFVAAMSGDETGNPDSVRQDYARMEAYNRGELSMYYGIYAVAVVKYSNDGGRTWRMESLKSGGIWVIASDWDSDSIGAIEQEELDDLRDHLITFGAVTSDFDEHAKHAQHVRE